MNLLLRGKQNAGSLPGRNTSTSSKGSQKAHKSSWWSLFSAAHEADAIWAITVPCTQAEVINSPGSCSGTRGPSFLTMGAAGGHFLQQHPQRDTPKYLNDAILALSIGRAERIRQGWVWCFMTFPTCCHSVEREQLELSPAGDASH